MINHNSKFAIFQRVLIFFLFTISAFFAGMYAGKSGYVYEIKRNPPNIKIINKAPPSKDVDFELFWQVWDMISTRFLERPVNGQDMLYGALVGMVESLGDPYTSFLPPEQNELVGNALNGVYEGIGAELGIRDNQLIIVAPLDGSPAKAAGVMARDAIVEIDGESTAGISITEAVAKIRGDAGTLVSLTMRREGVSDSFVIRIKRGQITIESVKWEDKGDGNIYIRISRFGNETNREWSDAVSDINSKASEIDAIILDVRGNPGGYLQGAVHIAGEFFEDKPVLFEEAATGETFPFKTERSAAFEGIPVFVLIDGGSASASEILAAALRDNIGATLVGAQSFGKGTIQDSRDFADGSGLHVTIAKWLTPSKEWVHDVGLAPDIIVEWVPCEEENVEDCDLELDAQLEKALELASEI